MAVTKELPKLAAYQPSWADRFTAWVNGLPMPAWVFYLVLSLVSLGLTFLTLWINGVVIVGTVLAHYLLVALSPAYLLALMHYQDISASYALGHFQPELTVDETGYEQLHYQLTTLPAGTASLATGVGAAFALGTLLTNAFKGTMFVLGPMIVMDFGYRVLISCLVALLAYHVFHQMWIINLIYTKYTHINLFHVGPLYALSSHAFRTGIGICMPILLWIWLNLYPINSLSMEFLLPGTFFDTMFLWTLLGAHQIMVREKHRLLSEVAEHIQVTMMTLHASIDANELGEKRVALKNTLEGLAIEQGVIQKLRTWPWHNETANGIAVAFLLPIILWIIQRLLTRFGI